MDELLEIPEGYELHRVGWWGKRGDGYPWRFGREIEDFAGLPEPRPVYQLVPVQ